MKYADINKRYTEIVAEYIGKGYTINTTTMNGSQGEIAKVDLFDGNEIVRIMVSPFSDWKANIEGFEILVGRVVAKDVTPNDPDWRNIIWNSKLEIISTERFYEIGRDSKFYGTQAEAEAAAALRFERYIARSTPEAKDLTEKAMEIAKRIIRREFGVKRICEADIKVTKHNGAYIIAYKTKSYRLH